MTYNEEPSLKHEWESVVCCPECRLGITTDDREAIRVCRHCGHNNGFRGINTVLRARRWVQTKSGWYFWLSKKRRGHWEYKDGNPIDKENK